MRKLCVIILALLVVAALAREANKPSLKSSKSKALGLFGRSNSKTAANADPGTQPPKKSFFRTLRSLPGKAFRRITGRSRTPKPAGKIV